MEEDVLYSALSVWPCQDIPTHSWRRASVTRPLRDVNGTLAPAPSSVKMDQPMSQRRLEVRHESMR